MIGQTLTTQQQYASQNRLILHGVKRSEPEGRQDRVYIRQVGGGGLWMGLLYKGIQVYLKSFLAQTVQ